MHVEVSLACQVFDMTMVPQMSVSARVQDAVSFSIYYIRIIVYK